MFIKLYGSSQHWAKLNYHSQPSWLFLRLNLPIMKKYLAAGLCLITLHVYAQKTPPKKTTTQKTTTSAQQKPLKNVNDSISYAIGLMVANFYKQQGIKNLNTAMVQKACNDVYTNKKPLLSENEANMALMRYMNPALTKNIA